MHVWARAYLGTRRSLANYRTRIIAGQTVYPPPPIPPPPQARCLLSASVRPPDPRFLLLPLEMSPLSFLHAWRSVGG